MNFELKKLDLEAAAIEKCDLLAVLVPEEFKPGRDALSALVAQAVKQGTLPKVGKHLPCTSPAAAHAWCCWERVTARRGCAASGVVFVWFAQRATDQAHGGVVCTPLAASRVSIAVQAVAEPAMSTPPPNPKPKRAR
jgi:leucyl aminopeptidase